MVKTSMLINNNYFKIIISLFLLGLFSCSQECIEIDVPYTDSEPYTDIEKERVELGYKVIDNKMWSERIQGAILFGENPKMKVYTRVANISEHGGVFAFYAKLNSQGQTVEFRKEEYIPSGTTKEISITKEINPFTFQAEVKIEKWYIKAPIVTIDKEVTKYRTIRKYRKCNTCVEDCAGAYKKSKRVPWYVYVLGGILVIGLLGKIFE
ncbi:hypothetical protein ACIRNY_04545 [Capnocytophaga canimorsus]|uniref:hypothetical protein n=1 Tax=Capnocytophaga canimorsus TaxID=28188 RepID=UPI00384E9742